MIPGTRHVWTWWEVHPYLQMPAVACMKEKNLSDGSTRAKGRDGRRSTLEHGVGPKVGGTTARQREIHLRFGLHGRNLVGVLGILRCVYVVLLGGLRERVGEEEWRLVRVTDHHVSWLVVGSGLAERVGQRRTERGGA